jgi:hypothetical protein
MDFILFILFYISHPRAPHAALNQPKSPKGTSEAAQGKAVTRGPG